MPLLLKNACSLCQLKGRNYEPRSTVSDLAPLKPDLLACADLLISIQHNKTEIYTQNILLYK